ncbi:MAG: glycosyltransferase [Candidatus Margulisbacteria bacterium]|jgi:glycosyltransferase involved in cell wall biosynthesis|nr:glycosyltransferase [Candidatus Margulisiibacteriota bacterium]
MDKRPLFSVIITAYNIEKYLAECLDSIIKQTSKNLEIIIVDDGSTDNSTQIYNSYAARDNRLKIFKQQNHGVAAARNTGLRNASAKYIHFVDGDDFLQGADYYARAAEVLARAGADIAVCGFYWENRNILFALGAEKTFTDIGGKMRELSKFPAVWRYIYKHEFLTKNNFWFDTTYGSGGEDTIFAVETAYQAGIMAAVPETIYHYRRNPGSIILSKDPARGKKLEDGTKYAWEKICQFAGKRNFDVSALNRWIPIRESRLTV